MTSETADYIQASLSEAVERAEDENGDVERCAFERDTLPFMPGRI